MQLSIVAQSFEQLTGLVCTRFYLMSLCSVAVLRFLCVLDLFACVSIVLYCMCMHVVLLHYCNMVRPVWMTNHPTSNALTLLVGSSDL